MGSEGVVDVGRAAGRRVRRRPERSIREKAAREEAGPGLPPRLATAARPAATQASRETARLPSCSEA